MTDKTTLENEEINYRDEDSYKKIAADPIKMQILKILFEKGPCPFGDVVRELSVSPAEGTEHIIELKRAGLINREVDPPDLSLETDQMPEVKKILKLE